MHMPALYLAWPNLKYSFDTWLTLCLPQKIAPEPPNSFKVSTDSVTTNEGSDSVSYLGLYLAILEEWNCLFQKDVKLANIHVSRLWKLGARFDIACRWLYSYRNWKICMLPHVHFSIYQSVGATENIMVAAVFQEGKTVLIMLQLIWPCSQMLSSSVTFSV